MGDTHGQLADVLWILLRQGLPSKHTKCAPSPQMSPTHDSRGGNEGDGCSPPSGYSGTHMPPIPLISYSAVFCGLDVVAVTGHCLRAGLSLPLSISYPQVAVAACGILQVPDQRRRGGPRPELRGDLSAAVRHEAAAPRHGARAPPSPPAPAPAPARRRPLPWCEACLEPKQTAPGKSPGSCSS